jgi:selenocysteine-specific elongation factor
LNEKHFILATAGHVDHGKSSLVKALTGTDPDRLPEEKARGMTLDLGFAHLELPASRDPSCILDLGIVDVPGHEDLVKTMVSGVGSIDAVLFAVAADDGWMPQTEEHLQIITYLGVTRAVFAITKTDMVKFSDVVVAQIREKLRGTPFTGAPILKTSTVTGTGIEELKSTLGRLLQEAAPQPDIDKPRLPVDRAFTLRGIGTVVTGTLTGGALRRGQEVIVWPSGQTCRIRTIQSYGSQVEVNSPGTRTALNLPDLVVSSDFKEGIRRGSVVTTADLEGPSSTLDVLLDRSARLAADKYGPVRALKDGALIRWHCHSANVPARLHLANCEQLRAGTRGLGQLRFDSPVFALAGDRFILRDWSEQVTLAGGIVLDAEADRKSFHTDTRLRFLQQRAASVGDVVSFVNSQLARDGAVDRSRLLLKTLFSPEDVSQAVEHLANDRKLILTNDLVVESRTWTTLWERMARAIDREHQAHPERLGLSLTDLRASIEPIAPLPELIHALTAALCASEFQKVGTFIRRTTHRPELPTNLQATGQRMRLALDEKPFEPPSRNQLAPDLLAQKALRFLLETGEAVEIGDDVVLSSRALRQIIATIQKTLQERGSATISELRKAIGTSRRIAVPLLEFLDNNGITRREGDKRILR